jgi:hypothetical protein
MRMTDYETHGDSAAAGDRPASWAEELAGAVFLALGLLLCALFWLGVYLLAGGPLP